MSSSFPVKTIIQLTNEPLSLDPTFVEDGAGLMVLSNTSAGLMGYNAEGQLIKKLAASYRATGQVYDFYLRADARWSDGKQIESQDFLYAWNRLQTSGSKFRPFFESISSIEAISPSHLRIKLAQPAAWLLHALTLPPMYPQRPQMVFSGPYVLKKHLRDRALFLVKNPYWSITAQSIQCAEFLIVSDDMTALRLVGSQRLDVATRLPLFHEPKKTVSEPFFATYYLSFATTKKPFDDVRWRRALVGALDKETIVNALSPHSRPASSWIPFGIEGYESFVDERALFQEDMEWAKKQVPYSFEFAFDANPRNQRMAEKIHYDLKMLPLQIALKQYDWRTYVATIRLRTPPLFRFARLSPLADPSLHLAVFTSGDPSNFSGFSDPRYDALVARIMTLAPSALRRQLIAEAQHILLREQTVVIPLYHYVSRIALSEKVKAFRMNPFGMIQITDIQVQP